MTTGRINQVTTTFDAPFARPRIHRSARLRNELNRVRLHRNGQPRRSARTARDSSDLVATPATRATTQYRSTQTCLQHSAQANFSHPRTKPTPIQRKLLVATTQPLLRAGHASPNHERPSHGGQHPIKQPDLPTREADALSPPSKTPQSMQAVQILSSTEAREAPAGPLGQPPIYRDQHHATLLSKNARSRPHHQRARTLTA